MTRFGYIIFFIILTGCSQQPQMTAWEHLRTALELDEASVLEYMALEHLPEIVAYDNTSALREAIHTDPDAAVNWLVENYRGRIISAVAADLPEELVPSLIQRHGDLLLDRLYTANPNLISTVAAQHDPYLTFDKAYLRDPAGILRRAIDRDPRYAAEYLRNYYGDLQ